MAHRNRTPFQRFLSSPVGIIVGIILCVLLGRAVYNVHAKAVLSSQRLAQAQAELARLQAEHDNLSKTVQYLSTDAGVEDEMRTKYRALRDGESVAVIVDASGTASSTDSSSDVVPPVSHSWWQSVKDFFEF